MSGILLFCKTKSRKRLVPKDAQCAFGHCCLVKNYEVIDDFINPNINRNLRWWLGIGMTR